MLNEVMRKLLEAKKKRNSLSNPKIKFYNMHTNASARKKKISDSLKENKYKFLLLKYKIIQTTNKQ